MIQTAQRPAPKCRAVVWEGGFHLHLIAALGFKSKIRVNR